MKMTEDNCWLSSTSVLSSSPFHFLNFIYLREADLEVNGNHTRPLAGDEGMWQQYEMSHPLLPSLPLSTRSRLGFLEPKVPITFSPLSLPGLALQSSPTASATCKESDMTQDIIYQCDFLPGILGLGQHHTFSRICWHGPWAWHVLHSWTVAIINISGLCAFPHNTCNKGDM